MFAQIMLPLTDEESLWLLTLLLIIFSILMAIICVILYVQIMKSEKVAKPFLKSFLFYFLILTIANFFQIYYNVTHFTFIIENNMIGMYTTYIVFLLTFAAPIYLIYQIEKIFFPNMKIQAKFHFFSMISLILLILFNIAVINDALLGEEIFPTFTLMNYIIIVAPLFALQLFYIVIAFLYLGYKAIGNYRKYSYLVSLGWFANHIANVIVVIFYVYPSSQNLYFIAKIIGVVVVAYCLYKLYALKTY